MNTLVEQNIEIARQFIMEGFGNGNLSLFDKLLAPNITVTTSLSPTGSIVGAQNYKEAFSEFRGALSLKSFSIDDIFGADNKVVVRFTVDFVFKKDFRGMKTANQNVMLQEVHILTFQGGKIINSLVCQLPNIDR
jgi:predicted ester cyclase